MIAAILRRRRELFFGGSGPSSDLFVGGILQATGILTNTTILGVP